MEWELRRVGEARWLASGILPQGETPLLFDLRAYHSIIPPHGPTAPPLHHQFHGPFEAFVHVLNMAVYGEVYFLDTSHNQLASEITWMILVFLISVVSLNGQPLTCV